MMIRGPLVFLIVFHAGCTADEPAPPVGLPSVAKSDGASFAQTDASSDLPETADDVAMVESGPDIAQYPPCCDIGDARCVPATLVPAGFEDQVNPCGTDGACVPAKILDAMADGGTFEPVACASLGGAAGVCLSACLPAIEPYRAILPGAGCDEDERCAPCIDPLSGEDSGACGGEIGGQTPVAASCDDPPLEPIVSVDAFPACCPGAHCVPLASVPAEDATLLDSCDSGAGLCVPDPLIESAGFYTPPTCESLAGAEGRCLSVCLPAVAARADVLPQSTCSDTQRCSPCCDPFSGEPTGACDQGCDVGPLETCAASVAGECCHGKGHCVAPELIPTDQQDSLKACKGDDKGLLCLPDVMQDPAFAGAPCHANSLILGVYDGVCLPTCLAIPGKILLDFLACPAKETCVPCFSPLDGAPTGAPGCST